MCIMKTKNKLQSLESFKEFELSGKMARRTRGAQDYWASTNYSGGGKDEQLMSGGSGATKNMHVADGPKYPCD